MRKIIPIVWIMAGFFQQMTSTIAQIPFNDKTYPFGIKPASASASTATAEYNNWKTDFVTTINAGGFQRVKYPQASNFTYTASEGIGYGMVLAAYHNDKLLYDDLFGFFNLQKNKRGLMCWNIPFSGIKPLDGSPDYNCATDADEDIAFSLIIANVQWGSSGNINYINEAAVLIDSLYKYCVDSVFYLLKPGDVYGDANCLNPSYFSLSYYSYFSALTYNSGWDSVRVKGASVLSSASSLNSTGLVGDWADEFGGLPSSCSWRPVEYEYDASRIPWRVGIDYLWNGSADSKTICDKIINWTLTSPISGNASVITDGYYKNGIQKGTNKNNPVISGFQTGAMASANGTWLNNLYNENLLRNDDWFFNRTTKVLSLFTASGNFWSPASQTLNIQEPEEEKCFSVFPNPMVWSAVIYSNARYIENCSIKIFDVAGNIVKNDSNINPAGFGFISNGVNQFPFTIERGCIASGIYILEISSKTKTERTKLIIN